MYYSGVTSRFMFWNGKDQYTVEFGHGSAMWYIFRNEENRDCVFKKEDKKTRDKNINIITAREVFYEYLESI